ncbi:ABC transporter substrate-binding protein [Paenibacillus sp. GYB003]|uniref:ABC transporter substrate-binding protein n=1 Tax=Paenibacillus sp. GYB003 TaxID=2994392 RepID=UPI002F9609D2
MRKKVRSALPALLLSVVVAAGCGAAKPAEEDGGRTGETKGKEREPVEITVSSPLNWVEEPFRKAIEDELKQTYPYISVNWVMEDKDNTLDKQIAAGNIPDVVLVSLDRIPVLTRLKLDYNMDPLIKQFQMNLGRFEQSALDMVKNTYGKPEQVALPYTIGFSALYYNKDIFDKFGVSYPKDGMTWEQAADLAAKVSRMDGGVQYRGIGFNGDPTQFLAPLLSLPYVDAKTGKATVNTDSWKKVLDTAKRLFDVPGSDPAVFKSGHNAFVKEKTLAMYVANNEVRNFKEDLNWDMVTVPVFGERPGTARTPLGISLAVTSPSKHKEEAFRVVEAFLSDRAQLEMVRNGRPSSLKSEPLRQEFGGNVSYLKGKNLMSIFMNKPAAFYTETEYDPLVKSSIMKVFDAVLNGSKDVNTALREAEEAANQAIAAERANQ